MQTYSVPMVPGPVFVPKEVFEAYSQPFGSADIEPEYLDLYRSVAADLQQLLGTQNQVVIKSGEGMIALWSALKSCLKPGDRVLSLGTGVFGYGVGDMARSLGMQVRTIGFGFDETLYRWDMIEEIAAAFRPKMITAVHCETPSGTLNPLQKLGEIKQRLNIPLLYVDAVASVGGAPVMADDCQIDLCLGGSQKALSIPPSLAFLSVSPRAWEIAEEVGYVGYDALLPFRHAVETGYFPYTPDWNGLAALKVGARLLLQDGLEATFARHAAVAEHTRQRLKEMDVEIFPKPEAISSPTVTAARVPARFSWPEFDARLRSMGLAVGGSYGPLAGKVFRLGHMGSQADMTLVDRALDIIAENIRKP